MREAMSMESIYPSPPRLPSQMPNGENAGSANQWADRSKSLKQFKYDANEEAERWWATHEKDVLCVIDNKKGVHQRQLSKL
jgi:hypothetical protein